MHQPTPGGLWWMHWELAVGREGDRNLVSVSLFDADSYCLVVRYDAGRDVWGTAHDRPDLMDEAAQLLGSRFPDDRDMTEDQALEFVACLAAFFLGRAAEDSR